VSNLMGQKREDQVIKLVKRISLWSILFCAVMVSILNVFPEMFFRLFGQSEDFVKEGIPVIRMVSTSIMFMSIANIWLNAVTGTGKTKVNLAIEIVAITLYLAHTWYFMKYNYVSLAVAWSNELIYWGSIFIMASIFIYSKRWKTKHP
ncbi:MAG: hypothetical protein EOP55_12115, partial [Sphingobacteriales bacterium]